MYLRKRTLNTGEGIQGKNEERLNKESVREPTLSREKKTIFWDSPPRLLPSPFVFFFSFKFGFFFFYFFIFFSPNLSRCYKCFVLIYVSDFPAVVGEKKQNEKLPEIDIEKLSYNETVVFGLWSCNLTF